MLKKKYRKVKDQKKLGKILTTYMSFGGLILRKG